MVILIDVLPAKGHFHATLKLASLLKEHNFEVTYGSHISLKSEVIKHGFKFENIPVLQISHINFIPRFFNLGNTVLSISEALFPHRFFQTRKEVLQFLEYFKKNKPDVILLDEQSALKAVLYEHLGIKAIFFLSKPDTGKTQGIPPFTTAYVPMLENIFSNLICNCLWFKRILGYRATKFLTALLTLNTDRFSIYAKVLKTLGIDIDKRIQLARSFGIGVKGFPRLIISPSAFDFPHPETKDVYRIGPLVDLKREGNISLPRYGYLLDSLKKAKNNNHIVVYCSMGTITSGFKNKVKRLFIKMTEVARINPDMLFIISTGKDFDINQILPAPDNLLIYDYVPQIDLLGYCDIMVTHGGMNSITECIFNEVPMLVYPLSPEWDQPGNSARVVFHKLGMKGNINRDSAKTISLKLKHLVTNYSVFKKSVTTMKERFEEKNSSHEVIHIIQKIIGS